MRRKNPLDEEIRKLTRLAETGDESAVKKLHAAQRRAGVPLNERWGYQALCDAVEEEHSESCDDNTCDISAAVEAGYCLWAARLLDGATEAPKTEASLAAFGPTEEELEEDRKLFVESVPHVSCASCGSVVWGRDGTLEREEECGNCLTVLPFRTCAKCGDRIHEERNVWAGDTGGDGCDDGSSHEPEADRETVCACGHYRAEHAGERGACEEDPCACQQFVPWSLESGTPVERPDPIPGELPADLRDKDILRHVDLDGYRLVTWSADPYGNRENVGYRLSAPNRETIFEGEDFHPSTSDPEDSDNAVRNLVGFLTLRPGDTDAEHFADYTPRQREFVENEAEQLSIYSLDDGPLPTDVIGGEDPRENSTDEERRRLEREVAMGDEQARERLAHLEKRIAGRPPRTGRAVELTKLASGNLEIKLTDEGREDLDEAALPDLGELLEWHLGNGWVWVSPEEIGALTDAPILTDEFESDDDGKMSYPGKVYWFPQYETIDPVQRLVERGVVIFAGEGGAHENPLDESLRSLEREAQAGDTQAAARLEWARMRIGERGERKYLVDLYQKSVVEFFDDRDPPIGLGAERRYSSEGPNRKYFAVGVKAVLIAAGFDMKQISVTTPSHWTGGVNITGPSMEADRKKSRQWGTIPERLEAERALRRLQEGQGWYNLEGKHFRVLAEETARRLWWLFFTRTEFLGGMQHMLSLNVRDRAGPTPQERADAARADVASWSEGPSLSSLWWDVFKAGVKRGLEGKRKNP